MSYRVLARRWRPQSFDDVIVQDHVTRTLKNAIEAGRVAHAYCFSGSRGVGKTTTARILAKALNCLEGPRPSPCQECDNCREIADGISPDVLEIDGATYTQVERVRELQENLQYAPARSCYKVYIVDEVHMLSRSAFNALLKTLEEPPAHVCFVFATTEPQRIPETILSRCQRFDFRQLSPFEIEDYLKRVCDKEKFSIPESGLNLIARAAEGSMRDALGLLDQLVSYAGPTISADDVSVFLGRADISILADVVESICHKKTDALMDVVKGLVGRGQDLRLFCRDLMEYIRHLLICRSVADPSRLIPYPKEEVARIQDLAKQFSPESLHRIFEGLRLAEQAVRGSDMPQWLLEVVLLRLASLEPVVPMEELLEKLALLEEATRTKKSVFQAPVSREPTLFEVAGEKEETLPERRPASGGLGTAGEVSSSPLASQAPVDTLEGLWERLLDAVEKRAFRVAQLLKDGEPVSLDKSTLAVRFRTPFCLTFFGESEHKSVVEEEARRIAGRPLRLEVLKAGEESKEASPGPRPPYTKPEPPPPDYGAKDHHEKMVQEVLKTFGGKVIEEGFLPPTDE